MKFFAMLMTISIITLSFVACNKGGGDNSTPAAPAPAAPTQPNYNQFTQYGFQPYGNNFAFSYGYGYCNCEPGFRPVYGVMGMGCVQITQINPFAAGIYFYGGAIPNNYQPVNIGQFSNITGYPKTSNCFNNVAYSCFIDQANYCGQGRLCRPTAPGSRIGICVNQ